MADFSLIARVIALEADMAFFWEEIERLNEHIAKLVTTIRNLRCAISNLQDFTFDAQDDKLDPDFEPKWEFNSIVEDSEGNPNGSDDLSNGASFGRGRLQR